MLSYENVAAVSNTPPDFCQHGTFFCGNLEQPRARKKLELESVLDIGSKMSTNASNEVRFGSNPVMWGCLLRGWSTPLGGLNSDDARDRGCASGRADGLFGARSIWSTSMRFAHWFKSWGRCSFAAGPYFSKLQHRLVRFCLGFAASRIRMWGAEMHLASPANRPAESAFA